MPGLALVQVLFPHAWHCRAASSSPLGSENKGLAQQVNSYPIYPLGRWPHGHWVGPGGSGRDPGWGHMDSWPQSGQIPPNTCTHSPSGDPPTLSHTSHPGDPQTHSSPAGSSPTEAARTLVALPTPHTGSLLSPHPTSRPPDVQTCLDLLFQTHWALIHTFTLRPTHEASDTGTEPQGRCPEQDVARPQDRSRTPRDILGWLGQDAGFSPPLPARSRVGFCGLLAPPPPPT